MRDDKPAVRKPDRLTSRFAEVQVAAVFIRPNEHMTAFSASRRLLNQRDERRTER